MEVKGGMIGKHKQETGPRDIWFCMRQIETVGSTYKKRAGDRHRPTARETPLVELFGI